MRVLILAEDPTLVGSLPLSLQREGHRVGARAFAIEEVETALLEGVDLIILEFDGLPFPAALDLCGRLRQETAMLLLVGRLTSSTERVRLIENGADDYVVSPFDLHELIARIHALLRRHPLSLVGQGARTLRVTEDLALDLAGQRLVGSHGETPLTEREFRLLAYLVRHEGVILSRDALLAAVWGPGYEGATREVDVYINYIAAQARAGSGPPALHSDNLGTRLPVQAAGLDPRTRDWRVPTSVGAARLPCWKPLTRFPIHSNILAVR